MNNAATQANSKDLRYLVNCGDKIDNRSSIFGEAPIHKAVLSPEEEKTDALEAIIEECHANVNNIDSNGWTPLHHAANIGDFVAVVAAPVVVAGQARVPVEIQSRLAPLQQVLVTCIILKRAAHISKEKRLSASTFQPTKFGGKMHLNIEDQKFAITVQITWKSKLRQFG